MGQMSEPHVSLGVGPICEQGMHSNSCLIVTRTGMYVLNLLQLYLPMGHGQRMPSPVPRDAPALYQLNDQAISGSCLTFCASAQCLSRVLSE